MAMECDAGNRQFKPGFLSNLNRSFRIGRTAQDRSKRSTLGFIRENSDNKWPTVEESGYDGDELDRVGNFRRFHSINANRKHNFIRMPEMPLGSELLKRVWKEGLDASIKDDDQLKSNEIATPCIDSYRFSMANLEDSQEGELDAILMDLCILQNECEEEIKQSSLPNHLRNVVKSSHNQSDPTPHQTALQFQSSSHVLSVSPLQRTDSPDNDSAFSDTVSMLSSESSTSSSVSNANKSSGLHLNLCHSKDAAFLAKQEKIKLALEKMKKASIKKLFIKAFSLDGSSKSLLVDEKMTCGYVTRLLADKNHVSMDPKWALVEHLTDLQMERVFEDHEILVDNLMLWARDSKNKIFFAEKHEKVSLFQTPEKYLVNECDKNPKNDYDEHSRRVLIEDFFNHAPVSDPKNPLNNANHHVPKLEGPLYLKSDAKKGWKKYHFVITPSGLFYYPKEKSKSKEMVCLANFGVNEIYTGLNWRKKYKAPTDYCFALKHPRLQQPKCVKYIKFLCAEEKESFDKWMVALRIAKHGKQLLDNYRTLSDELAQDDLDKLAHARSCSVISISQNSTNSLRQMSGESPSTEISSKLIFGEGSITGSSSSVSSGRHSCTSSSSSSGCLSDSGPSASEGNIFDSEYSTGTIKRKPSMKPNLPLTSMTRQLKEMADSASVSSYSDHSTSVYTNTGTLTRQSTRRKSTQSNNTDDSSSSDTLKLHNVKNNRGSLESMTSNSSNNSVNHKAVPFNYNIHNEKEIPSYIKNVLPKTNQTYNGTDHRELPKTGILMGYITQQHNQNYKLVSENNRSESEISSQAIYNSFDQSYDTSFNSTQSFNDTSFNSTKSVNSSRSSNDMKSFDVSQNSNYSELSDIDNNDIQNLPLPPPPNFSNDNCYSYDPMFSSTLSLESLPPPPPEEQSPNRDLSQSQLSLVSLPPPPTLTDLKNILNNHVPVNSAQESVQESTNKQNLVDFRGEFPNTISVMEVARNINKTISSESIKNSLQKQKTNNSFSVAQNRNMFEKNLQDREKSDPSAVDNVNTNKTETATNKTKVEFSYKDSANNSVPQFNISQNSNKTIPQAMKKITDNSKNITDATSPVLLRRKQVSFTTDISPTTSYYPQQGAKLNNVSIISDDSTSSNTSYGVVKPPPPKRNENTRLSSPKKLSDSACNPPKNFLINLQRVMQKKWQVAQKCKLEPSTSPHEVLGFREFHSDQDEYVNATSYVIPKDIYDYKETNVSNWVQEHYGNTTNNLSKGLYENLDAKCERVNEYGSNIYATASNANNLNAATYRENDAALIYKKRPPPPIPKRSENTQLSALSMQKSH